MLCGSLYLTSCANVLKFASTKDTWYSAAIPQTQPNQELSCTGVHDRSSFPGKMSGKTAYGSFSGMKEKENAKINNILHV